ncbi:hypothetical protein RUND412_005429 [Rhizina undulata]
MSFNVNQQSRNRKVERKHRVIPNPHIFNVPSSPPTSCVTFLPHNPHIRAFTSGNHVVPYAYSLQVVNKETPNPGLQNNFRKFYVAEFEFYKSITNDCRSNDPDNEYGYYDFEEWLRARVRIQAELIRTMKLEIAEKEEALAQKKRRNSKAAGLSLQSHVAGPEHINTSTSATNTPNESLLCSPVSHTTNITLASPSPSSCKVSRLNPTAAPFVFGSFHEVQSSEVDNNDVDDALTKQGVCDLELNFSNLNVSAHPQINPTAAPPDHRRWNHFGNLDYGCRN